MRIFIALIAGCGGEEPPPPLELPAALEVSDGMVKVPAAVVRLGPRHVPPVEGYQAPSGPEGMTPGMGEGSNRRAAGAPPPVQPGGHSPGTSGPGSHNGPPNGPPLSGGAGSHGPGGNGPPGPPGSISNNHVRGGGAPSAPPGMPGNAMPSKVAKKLWETGAGGQRLQPIEVSVSSFWIDLTEVTRAQYKEFLDATGYRPPFVAEEWAEADPWNWSGTDYPEGTGDHPVVLVSWYDATEFCAWAGKRLPTESEWQLAALGPASGGRIFPWGDTYEDSRLNHGKMDAPNYDDSDGYEFTSPVGAFPTGRSPYGLYDAFGNAWEFTSDWRRDDWSMYVDAAGEALTSAATKGDDITAPGPGLYAAVRGGAYFFDLRPNPGGERNEFLPEIRRKTSGFRCAR